jgi:SAM-dependent methyltransferase
MVTGCMFIDPKIRYKTIDIYIVRKSIYDALRDNVPLFHGTLLDVGCGELPYKSFFLGGNTSVTTNIGLDLHNSEIYNKVKPDVVWDGNSIPLENGSIDCALATEVFEHCHDPEIVMNEISRVLKPGGVLFFTVPFVWPLHDVPNDHYRYTPFSLERHLRCSGFQKIEIRALGGWDASLAQMIGLWVNRRPHSRYMKKLLQVMSLPLIKLLVKKDVPPTCFSENAMITGFYGTANKVE